VKIKSTSPLLELARGRNWLVCVQLRGMIGNLKRITHQQYSGHPWCRTKIIESRTKKIILQIELLQAEIDAEWKTQRKRI